MCWIKRIAWLLLWLGAAAGVAAEIVRGEGGSLAKPQAADTVLMDFYADWCGPCQAMAPTVENLVQAGYAVRRINIDRQPDMARQYNIGAIPCFVVVQEGREIDRVTGMTTIERLKMKLSPLAVLHGAKPQAARDAVWRYERPVGCYSAVVRIRCELTGGQRALGSGVLVRWGGRIAVLTARHVVRDARTIVVRLVTGREHTARVLVTSEWDCAVLQLHGDVVGVEPAKMELGRAAEFHAGDRLTSCGYGGAETRLAANSGLFIGYRRGAQGGDGHDDWFELSGPARQGDSGGPVFDDRGRVVGIVWGTDGKTVIGVQAGRLHIALEAATKFYRQQADRPDLHLVPVVLPPEIERNPTPPMISEGLCGSGCDCKRAPALPWRADELKRDAALEARIRAQQAEIDGLVELERSRQNSPPVIDRDSAKPQADAPSPLLAAIVVVGSLAVGGFFYSKTKKRAS